MSNLIDDTIVVILGGGQGKRLFPLTKMRSKPAVPIGGKYRLIDIPISNVIHSDLSRIYILTQFNSASLNQHIARTFNFDHFRNGFVEVLAAEQTMGSDEWFQGTADAVRKIYPHLEALKWKNILILSGDHLYRMDYSKFLKHHSKHKADASICVLGIKEKKASEFGLLKVGKNSHIYKFSEKPTGENLEKLRLDTTQFGYSPEEAKKKPFLASMGIYIFKREILKDVLFSDTNLHDFGKEIIPQCLLKRLTVSAYLFQDFWEDIGTIKSFFDANLNLCKIDPPFQLNCSEHPVFTHQRHLPGTIVDQSNISKCIINDGCVIKNSHIKDSIVGLRTFIDTGVKIEGSLIMGADYYDDPTSKKRNRLGIGKNSIIKNAIIDKNAAIGKNVRIENKNNLMEYDDPKERFYIRDGIVIVVKGAIIPNNMII